MVKRVRYFIMAKGRGLGVKYMVKRCALYRDQPINNGSNCTGIFALRNRCLYTTGCHYWVFLIRCHSQKAGRSNIMSYDLNARQVRQVYLITYSRGSPDISRQGLADKVVTAFETCGTARVLQWACSQELHADGGLHYHMSLKLDRTQRWLKVRNHLAHHDGLAVNFSSIHHNYFSAWKYVTKTDQAYLQSQGHPDLTTSFAPLTNDASKAVVQATHTEVKSGVDEGEPSENTARGRKRAPRLTAYDVSQMVVEKGFHSRLQLLAYAEQQRREGKSDLLRFIVNRGKRAVEEAIKVNIIPSPPPQRKKSTVS